jgi:hypothetical protein
MNAIDGANRRFTLRGKIGSRDAKRPRRMSAMVEIAIGCYVVSTVMGWACVGLLIAVVWP